ncbi:MAG: AAA family ATPase, partial [Candidatus Rokuibacteriota bacterium]
MIVALDLVRRLEANVGRGLVGKPEVVRLAVIGLLARGHLLIEDVPGVGKTTLAKALARSIGGDFKRVQFTPDLLPLDITGASIFNQKVQDFEFKHGPVFTNVLLADEINRATPRTQSALLECMEEFQVSVDGRTHKLSDTFLVIATLNPVEQTGTFPLPETQLDRFLLRLRLGYPTEAEEVQIFDRQALSNPLDALRPAVTADDIRELRAAVQKVFVHASV